MRPSEIAFVGPSPMKSSVAAMSIAPPNWRMNVINRYDIMFGAISVNIIFKGFIPLILARSTKSLERKENVWALMALAAQGQAVNPIKILSIRTPLTLRFFTFKLMRHNFLNLGLKTSSSPTLVR